MASAVYRLKIDPQDRLFVEPHPAIGDPAAGCARLLRDHADVVPIVTCVELRADGFIDARFFDARGERAPAYEDIAWVDGFYRVHAFARYVSRISRERPAVPPQPPTAWHHVQTTSGTFELKPFIHGTGNRVDIIDPGGKSLGLSSHFDWGVLAPHNDWLAHPEKILFTIGSL